MVEGRSFTIYTDHKSIIYAFQKKSDQCSPRQFRHLEFISQLSTDIRHISREDNVVADALSHISTIETILDNEALAAAQRDDMELKTILEDAESSLQLKQIRILDADVSIFCDVSTRSARPYITEKFRKAVFNTIHNLSHPRIKSTVKLVTQRYVWPSIKSDCKNWARSCIDCQKLKVSRHGLSPVSNFSPPSS